MVVRAACLLEREDERKSLASACAAARRGEGEVVLVSGPVGIGKTELLRAGLADARVAGLPTYLARASDPEGSLAFGVVRQLFEPALSRLAAAERDLLLAGPAEIFARNQLVIVTKPGNPRSISSLADLATAGIISLCADTAPCGKFANQILGSAAVSIPETSVTRGQDVKATLTAVTEGDAEAAIVYVPDATASGDAVDTVEIPEADNVVADYPIAVMGSSPNAGLAEAFMAFVLGDNGQAALADAGFLSK